MQNKLFILLLIASIALSPLRLHADDNTEKSSSVVIEPQTTAENKEANPQKPKYNRRVLLTVFVNEQHDKNTEYLSVSVPDAFSSPLVKTGNFVVLNRNSVDRYLKTMGVATTELYSEENAICLGKAVGADVVVVGKFATVGDTVTIEAKAVDVQAGLLSVQDSEQIKTNTTMFASINRLAERMSVPMAEKMKPLEVPPPPAEVVLDEEQVVAEVKRIEEKKTVATPLTIREHWLWLDAGLGLLQPFGTNKDVIDYDGKYPYQLLNPGWGFLISYESTLPDWRLLNFLRNFHYLASLGYARFGGTVDVISTTGTALLTAEEMTFQQATLQLALGRRFAVWRLTLMPFAGFSIDFAKFSASKAEVLFSGVVPGIVIGGRVIFFHYADIECGGGYTVAFKYLNEGNIFLSHTINLSVGYKL